MADPFLHLPIEDRREALGVAADRSGRPAHLLEKDVWVVWALAILYGSALGEHLVFKGGTSLSKAYQVSRDFLMAKKRADQEVLLPPGPKIVVTGGLAFDDHRLIWAKLDQVHEKHPDMVLVHGKSPKGAEKIASLWAKNRNVPQIGFAPDWTKHGRAAPFKRNDVMLEIVPKGVMHFPGAGISDNLADKTKKLGIPVWKFGGA